MWSFYRMDHFVIGLMMTRYQDVMQRAINCFDMACVFRFLEAIHINYTLLIGQKLRF